MVSLYTIAVLMTFVDRDVLIARYNMAHREKAFVQLKYLATLDDKALPHLTASTLQLERLDLYNREVLGGTRRYNRWLYVEPVHYARSISERVESFLQEYPERSWREWNLADAQAHTRLLPLKN